MFYVRLIKEIIEYFSAFLWSNFDVSQPIAIVLLHFLILTVVFVLQLDHLILAMSATVTYTVIVDMGISPVRRPVLLD